MKKELKISILDFGYRQYVNFVEGVQSILDYAELVEKLGFNRFWLAEHHNEIPYQTYYNIDHILNLVALNTEKIRIGSAGVLIGFHSPYDVFCNYVFLNNLHGNRIDLGFAKGFPGNIRKNNYMNFDIPNDYKTIIYKNMRSFIKLYNEKDMLIPPYQGRNPDLWYLSNNFDHIDYCISNGLNLGVSLMHGQNAINNKEKSRSFINEKKEIFKERNNKEMQITITIAVSFDFNENDIKEYELYTNESAMTIIAVNEKNFKEKINEISDRFSIEDVTIFDVEMDPQKKIENLLKMQNV